MKLNLLFLAIFFLNYNTLTAQNSTNITGLVHNSVNRELSFANVFLVKNDSMWYNTVTNKSGNYTLSNVIPGNYFLQIKLIGYTSYNKEIVITNKNIEVPKIILNKSADAIKEVIVTAAKPVSKFNTEKKVYNVGQDITATGGTAADVLKNVPSLQVDPIEGNVSIRGNDNITLLIDGKPSVIFGNDIAEAMRSIPASSIESVEVITNPGAQFDAQGKGGVLNIVLKKERKAGYNGNIGINTGWPYRLNLNLGLNANIKKWNVFMNANGRTARNIIFETSTRNNLINNTSNVNINENHRRPQSGFINFGADYTINKFNKISISQSLFGANMLGNISSDIDGFNNNVLTNTTFRDNIYTGNPRNGTTALNYIKTFVKKGQELRADVSIGISQYKRISDFNTDSLDGNNNIIIQNLLQSIPVKGGNNNVTASTDFTTSINNKTKIDVGLKTIQFNFRSENFPTITRQGQPEQFDIALKNKFNFNQQTYAAYTNFKQQYDVWGYQLGLRAEHFAYDGFVYQYNLPTKAQFNNLFPSAYVSYKLKNNSEISMNYTRRTNRPNFFQLIPYIDITNPLDTSIGNQNLKPEFINAIEAGYSKTFNTKNSFLTTVYYQLNNNLIQRYKRFNNNGTTFSQPRNLNSGETFGAEASMKYFINKNWEANVNGNLFYNLINGSEIDASINRQGWAGFAKFITNYKLLKKYDLQLSGNYNSKTPIAQGYIDPYYNIDAAIKTSFLKGNALTVTLSANDIFNTVQQTTFYDVPNVFEQSVYRKQQTRQIVIGVQFRFLSKSSNPNEAKQNKPLPSKKPETKDAKNRDENLKKDGDGEDSGSGGSPQNR
jgi:iron complex outermembrane recepter protein